MKTTDFKHKNYEKCGMAVLYTRLNITVQFHCRTEFLVEWHYLPVHQTRIYSCFCSITSQILYSTGEWYHYD
jgi:hypothetical protein